MDGKSRRYAMIPAFRMVILEILEMRMGMFQAGVAFLAWLSETKMRGGAGGRTEERGVGGPTQLLPREGVRACAAISATFICLAAVLAHRVRRLQRAHPHRARRPHGATGQYLGQGVAHNRILMFHAHIMSFTGSHPPRLRLIEEW